MPQLSTETVKELNDLFFEKAFVDIATTGINPDSDNIMEIAILYQTNQPSIHYYVNPEVSLSKNAIDIHGYNDTFLKNKPTFKEIKQEIRNGMKNKTLVLYNAQFILPFLEKALGEVIKNDIIDIIDSRYKNKIDHAKSYNIKLSKRASCQYDAMKECYITAEIYEKQRSV